MTDSGGKDTEQHYDSIPQAHRGAGDDQPVEARQQRMVKEG